MRPELLTLLRCGACYHNGAFALQADVQNRVEIVSGQIACEGCGATFNIREGCCDLLLDASATVMKERAAQHAVETRDLDASLQYRDLVANEAALGAFIHGLPWNYAPTAEQAPLVEHVIEQLELRGNETVLDVGAGMCWTTSYFARLGCKAVAVDISEIYMPRSRFLLTKHAYFDRIFADMTVLPLADKRFDIVFANAAIHHSPDMPKTVWELARVLKPEGRLVLVNEPVAGAFEKRRLVHFGREEIADGFNENIYRVSQWRRAFAEAGLTVRFTIPSAGIAEKVQARREKKSPGPLRRLLLTILAVPVIRAPLLAFVRPLALRFYPFNVVMWGGKKR